MYKVKLLNEYQIKELLNNDNFEPERFYKDELIKFLNISIENNKKLNKQKNIILNQINNHCNECHNKECCSENNCVLYRIETILNERENI